MIDDKLLNAAVSAACAIKAIYEHLDRVEAAGGAMSISGVAACRTMLKSLRQNQPRLQELIIDPLNAAIEDRRKEQNQ